MAFVFLLICIMKCNSDHDRNEHFLVAICTFCGYSPSSLFPSPCQYFHSANTGIGVIIWVTGSQHQLSWKTALYFGVFLIQIRPLLWLLCYCINTCATTRQEVTLEQFKQCLHILRLLSITAWFADTSRPMKGLNVVLCAGALGLLILLYFLLY